MSFTTQTVMECMFVNFEEYLEVPADATTEKSLLPINQYAMPHGSNKPIGMQAVIPALYFHPAYGIGKTLKIELAGRVTTPSGTMPVVTLGVRIQTSPGTTVDTGAPRLAQVSGTPAQSVQRTWRMEVDVTCRRPGLGGNRCILQTTGVFYSFGVFDSAAIFPVTKDGTEGIDWEVTADGSLTYYVQPFVKFSAVTSGVACQLKLFRVWGMN